MVTGSEGFVGRHLTDYLTSECGHLVGRYDIQGGLDITDKEQVFDFFERFKPNVVYHLAAQVNAKRSEEDRERDWKINVVGTLNIIDAMIKNNCNVLTFASSGAAYAPVSNYGVTKKAAEEYILKYTRQGKIQGKICRFSSVYGFDRHTNGWAGAINRFLVQGISEVPITLHGTGTSTRDFTHVYDVVRAMELVQRNGHYGQVYNIGTGIQHPVYHVAEIAGFFTQTKIELVEANIADIKNPPHSTTELARLGFVPKYDLYSGMREVYHQLVPYLDKHPELLFEKEEDKDED